MGNEKASWLTKSGVELKTWICPKCELMRCNQITHKHGIPLPSDFVKSMEGGNNVKEKGKAVHKQ